MDKMLILNIFLIMFSFLAVLVTAELSYPKVRRNESISNNYFGVEVQDPYQWMENMDSNETKEFIAEEQQLTLDYLNKSSARKLIQQRLTELAKRTKMLTPIKAGSRYFTYKNRGLENYLVMYVHESFDDPGKEFLDVNKLSSDGSVSMEPTRMYSGFSRDGSIFAYSVQKNGSDWVTIFFRNVSTAEDFPDKLHNCKYPFIEWSADNKGIFYTKLFENHEANESDGFTNGPAVYYHILGTMQDQDILIVNFPEHPLYYLLKSELSDDKKYLIISATQSFDANAVYLYTLEDGVDQFLRFKMVSVFPNATEASYKYVTNHGTTFIFQTNKDASNFKLICVNIDLDVERSGQSSISLITTFVEEHPKKIMNLAFVVDNDKMVLSYMEDVKHTLELRSLDTGLFIQKLNIPEGSISEFTRQSSAEKEFFFTFENFVTPGTIYRCEIVQGTADCIVTQQLSVPNIDLNNFVTEQIFYPSKDGTLIPMYIVKKKDVTLNASTPALLTGYGGFNKPMLPKFSVKNLAFIDMFNGIFALANIRGGGEYGNKWYAGGSMHNKQNSFDDFQAAAEYLIKNNYTSASKIAIEGSSNGGLLVSACVNQRPDLFGAAIVEFGVMDMLRANKFTIGFIACSEYGCPDTKENFETLRKYSPLHNIHFPLNKSDGEYPAVLVITGDHDDRVPPLHSYKYLAELQYIVGRNPRQTKPLLLRVEKNAGHGTGMTIWKMIDETTSIFSFLAETLDLHFNVK